MRKTAIVVPCYNEAERLDAEAFLSALENAPDLSFLFVDDGSTDSTIKLLQSMQQRQPARIDIFPLGKNCGKAEAVRCGMLKVIDAGFDTIGYWDADLATPLAEIREFCNLLETEKVSIVVGSRVLLLGKNIQRKPLKHYAGRVFATCASLLLQIPVYDTQCGAKIFRNTPLVKQVFAKPFKVNWTFDVEMLGRFPILAHKTGSQACAEWYEKPLSQWIDVSGSKVSLKDYFIGGIELITLFAYLRTPLRSWYEKFLCRP